MLSLKRRKSFKSLSNISIKRGSKGIYSTGEFKNLVEKERARADRNNHEVSLMVFDLGTSDLEQNDFNSLIQEIKSRIRFIDLMGWYDEHQIGLLLPYTSNKGAIKLAENIHKFLDDSISKPVCSVYTYPVK